MRRIPLPDRLAEAEAQMSEQLAEAIFGEDPEKRVRNLRRSILGDDAVSPENEIAGLAAWLP